MYDGGGRYQARIIKFTLKFSVKSKYRKLGGAIATKEQMQVLGSVAKIDFNKYF